MEGNSLAVHKQETHCHVCFKFSSLLFLFSCVFVGYFVRLVASENSCRCGECDKAYLVGIVVYAKNLHGSVSVTL